jgi:pimeloyl-ACP methyl ester carboxylesterase
LYDQRSHGQSGRSEAENCTVEQLGADLERILEERVPHGPVVLVGHSMGGMTIMSLADRRPDLFGDRVVAVALLSTSAGKLASVTFGLPALAGVALQRALPRMSVGLGRRGALVERARRSGSDLSYAMTRHLSFATPVPTEVLDLMDRMISDTSVEVISAFAPALLRHDMLAALPALKKIAHRLARFPRVLVHRDFQSQNLIVRDGEVYLIDFQGMRPGLAEYDLASLLYDPYVNLTNKERDELTASYKELNPDLDAEFAEKLKLCAIQRLMQALGAYGYLGLVKGNAAFLTHIPGALYSLHQLVRQVEGLEPLQVLLETLQREG